MGWAGPRETLGQAGKQVSGPGGLSTLFFLFCFIFSISVVLFLICFNIKSFYKNPGNNYGCLLNYSSDPYQFPTFI